MAKARATRSPFSPVGRREAALLAEVDEPYDRVYLTYASSPEERFFGCARVASDWELC
jgi:hypothetical protein